MTYETSPALREAAQAFVTLETNTKFPPQVGLAMWANESGWGQHLTGDFNYWGITRAPETGPAKFCATTEEIMPAQLAGFREDERKTARITANLGNGKYRYEMHRWFASYASAEESFAAYIHLVTTAAPYAPAWRQFLNDGNADAYLKGICAAGYATGQAGVVELAIEHQANIAHAIAMARAEIKQ